MQTPNSRKNCSSEIPQRRSPPQSASSRLPLKISPRAGSSRDASQKISPRVVRQLVPDSTLSSPNVMSKTTERSPKPNEKRSPKSLGSEKRPGRVSELESRVSELQNDLKKVKDELCSTEALKSQAVQEAEESKKQLAAMKTQLTDCQDSESRAQLLVKETLLQLETAKKTMEALKSDGAKATEAYNAVTMELDQSRAHVNLLEEHFRQLESDVTKSRVICDPKNRIRENEELKSEIESLREALEAAVVRNHEEQTITTVEIQNAHEFVEKIKLCSSRLEAEVQKLRLEIEELKANLMDKETELQGICEENENLASRLENRQSGGRREYELEKELQKSKLEIENLKAKLTENAEAGRVTDKAENAEAGRVTDKAENAEAVRVMEELETVQATNIEMEGELRRLKVQCDQWRKAAEAAAAMLSGRDNNGKFMTEKPGEGKISPTYNHDDADEDLVKRKNNANVLKRLGISWKKQQK